MERIVEPEWLDALPARDRRALRSRRDIRRLNFWMGHARILARALRKHWSEPAPIRLAEIGAGDGLFLLSVAKRLRKAWPAVNVTLVDRQDVFAASTRVRLQRLGWNARLELADVTDWLRQAEPPQTDILISNLFLHQFPTGELQEILRLAAAKARLVIAVEPLRSEGAHLMGKFLWLAGCGPVTRHDGPVSIRAGFAGQELSALWPDAANWELQEQPAGSFSHLFVARRKA
ncbi:MAG TPA: methyltransferase domain-containing protein [Dongiaceae bacterium]|nr:methyltransferase domain-containing protein [Dongiaceae bacterium]